MNRRCCILNSEISIKICKIIEADKVERNAFFIRESIEYLYILKKLSFFFFFHWNKITKFVGK